MISWKSITGILGMLFMTVSGAWVNDSVMKRFDGLQGDVKSLQHDVMILTNQQVEIYQHQKARDELVTKELEMIEAQLKRHR